MRIKCPSCKKVLKVPDHLQGKVVQCSCGKRLKTPNAGATHRATGPQGSSAGTPASKKSVVVKCEGCQKTLKVPGSLLGRKVKCKCGAAVQASNPSGTKKSPAARVTTSADASGLDGGGSKANDPFMDFDWGELEVPSTPVTPFRGAASSRTLVAATTSSAPLGASIGNQGARQVQPLHNGSVASGRMATGYPQASAGMQVYSSSKSKVSAGLLALFLGGIGAHRFYLGQAGLGLIYLLTCWTFIPGLIAFFEAIMFFVMSDEDFNARYGQRGVVMNQPAVRVPASGVVAGKSKVTAGILALFLGGIGAHRFYLGQTGIGLIYLLTCWTFIPGLVAFIEAIMFFAMSDQDFHARYGQSQAVMRAPLNYARQQRVVGQKNKVVAALLALFLGGIGVHKFYLNQPLLGILYLLFCATFLPSLIAFLEAIIYLCTSDQDFAAKYG